MSPDEIRAAARRQYAARTKPVKECAYCWTVGAHHPKCRKADTTKASAARRTA